ncbi:MAG: cobyrinate a,c-diamide synthase [Paracoccaceae bacterium]|nr:cobyrinate a,c-diamide synthase [Paracoccaceae bacterium]
MTRAIVLAAANSGAGKTTLTLGLLRALKNRGINVRAAKSGPDYIDPAFHAVACGHPSINLDAWAMTPAAIRGYATSQQGDLLIVEGAMGVLDAGADNKGSVADLAQILGIPIVMVLDIAKQAQSAALSLAGLTALRPDIPLAGTILNRAGSAKHVKMAKGAIERSGFNVLGHVQRNNNFTLPERHLGLVQAAENKLLDEYLDQLADEIEKTIDVKGILACATPLITPTDVAQKLPPLGQRISVASDLAFSFIYPHLLADWHSQGASIHTFSPLNDEGPAPDADAVFLPGGYPELHAQKLANAVNFKKSMNTAAQNHALIYGECGGFMVLGNGLIDAKGETHEMLGFLPLTTSFETRKLSLGYRRLTPCANAFFQTPLLAHEFHYSTIAHQGDAQQLFKARDATHTDLPDMGLQNGRILGSYAHIIAPNAGER